MHQDLAGKVALITGAGRGLGASLARRLAHCGAATVINYSRSKDKAEARREQLHREGCRAATIQTDERDELAYSFTRS